MGFSGWDIAGLRAWNFPTEGAPERTFPWSPFNMIKTLWARVSKMWLLGELGMGFFYSAPQDFVMLGVFCARFPPREASFFFTKAPKPIHNGNGLLGYWYHIGVSGYQYSFCCPSGAPPDL